MYKVGVYGIEGSYSHQVAKDLFENTKNFIFEPSMQSILKDLEKDVFGLAVIPVENNLVGRVDLFHLYVNKFDIEIIGEKFFEVEHCLVGNVDTELKNIKKVLSHPMALRQCDNFLNKHNFLPVETKDTSQAAKEVFESKDISQVAISSGEVLKYFNLKILKNDISNEASNITRFFIIKKKGKDFDINFKHQGSEYMTSGIFTIKSEVGSLLKMLENFSKNNINLTRIESQIDSKFISVSFFIDFEGGINDKNVKKALDQINNTNADVKILGSYKIDRFRNRFGEM